MTPDFKKQWAAALRSGEYEQHRGGWVDNFHTPTQFCCLSVALTEAGKFEEWAVSRTVAGASEFLKIDYKAVVKLMNMNDKEWCSFNEIADWIDTNELSMT